MKKFNEWLQVREGNARLVIPPSEPDDGSADQELVANFARLVQQLGWDHPNVKQMYKFQMDTNSQVIRQFQQIIAAAQKPKTQQTP